MPSENIQLLLKIKHLWNVVMTTGVLDSEFVTFISFGPICLGEEEITLEITSTQNRSTTVKKIEVLNHFQNAVKAPGIYTQPAT